MRTTCPFIKCEKEIVLVEGIKCLKVIWQKHPFSGGLLHPNWIVIMILDN